MDSDNWNSAQETIESLRAENEELKKDAIRREVVIHNYADVTKNLQEENAKLWAELASVNGKLDSQRLQTERAQKELYAYRNQEPVGKVVDTDMLGTPIVRWQRLPNMAEFLFTNQIEVKQK